MYTIYPMYDLYLNVYERSSGRAPTREIGERRIDKRAGEERRKEWILDKGCVGGGGSCRYAISARWSSTRAAKNIAIRASPAQRDGE